MCFPNVYSRDTQCTREIRIISSPFWLLEMSVALLDTRSKCHSKVILSIQKIKLSSNYNWSFVPFEC